MALPCLLMSSTIQLQPFLHYIAVDLDLFCCHSNAIVRILFAECLCSSGKLRELHLKN